MIFQYNTRTDHLSHFIYTIQDNSSHQWASMHWDALTLETLFCLQVLKPILKRCKGQRGLYPSRAQRNCLTWSDKMTAVLHLHHWEHQQHQWYSSAGGRWGRNTGDMQQKSNETSYLEREHMTCSNGIERALSVSSVSRHAKISFSSQRKRNTPCAHGLRRRWSDIPVMRMEKSKQNHRPCSTRAIGMITARISHHISHTRKTRVMKKRRTKGERDREREGGGEERARARVCVCAITSVDRSKCTVCMSVNWMWYNPI